MKFGIFYELQCPRPWELHTERDLYQNALTQGCEPKLWDQAAAFDDASGWLRLAGADGLSASAAQ